RLRRRERQPYGRTGAASEFSFLFVTRAAARGRQRVVSLVFLRSDPGPGSLSRSQPYDTRRDGPPLFLWEHLGESLTVAIGSFLSGRSGPPAGATVARGGGIGRRRGKRSSGRSDALLFRRIWQHRTGARAGAPGAGGR